MQIWFRPIISISLPGDLGVSPSTYMVAYNICESSHRVSDTFSWPAGVLQECGRDMHTGTEPIHIKIN